MTISQKDWNNYINKLSRLSNQATKDLLDWVAVNGIEDRNALIDYAYAVTLKYGEGSAELSALMYDSLAELSGANILPAIPAPMPSIGDVGRAINGSLKQSPTGQKLGQVVGRLVKQAGADTTLQNALRDGAEFAWIPSGDTCAFCIALASRGWQRASKDAISGGHAEHIHANCNCEYAIRFDKKSGVKGYNPKKYEEMYREADGSTPNERINFLRRQNYQENRETILEQKRESYEIRNGETE